MFSTKGQQKTFGISGSLFFATILWFLFHFLFQNRTEVKITNSTLKYFANDQCHLNMSILKNSSRSINLSPSNLGCYPEKSEKSTIHEGIFQKSLLITFGLFLSLCIVSYYLMHFTRTAKLVNEFPGSTPFPILGNALNITGPLEDLITKFESWAQRFGRTFRIWLFHQPYLAVMEADVVEKILSSSIHIDKGRDYKMFTWLLGNGLVTANVQDWKRDRKLLQPTFKYQRFDGFLASFNKHGKILSEILGEKFNKGFTGELNLHSRLCMCTMDSILESALGQNSSLQYDPNLKFLENAYLAFTSFRKRIMEPYLVFPIIWDIFGFGRQEPGWVKYFMDYFGEIINERRTTRFTDHEEITKPFIDGMLDCRTDEYIAFHVITMFGAGYETTASSLNYLFYLLATNPDIQTKVHEELDQVFSGDDSQRDVTFDDLAQLKYLNLCIQESLRLFPPAPIIIREPKSDVKLENGLIIPRGTQVMFFIYGLHRDPKVFPDPEKFDPDRFLPEACSTRSRYAYIPFSAGPRGCLGQKYAMMQIKCVAAHVLRAFRVSSSKNRETLKVIYGMVLEPMGGLPLRLVKRV